MGATSRVELAPMQKLSGELFFDTSMSRM